MLRSLFLVKFFHTIIFLILSMCVGIVLYTSIVDNITSVTWISFIIILIEGAVLTISGWKCPLTKYAEKLGAANGTVTDIFLPRWIADRTFLICGIIFTFTTFLLFYRLVSRYIQS